LTSCFFLSFIREGGHKSKEERGHIMTKKILKKIYSLFIIILILVGIMMSMLNFSVKAYARDPIWGTITVGDGTLTEAWWALAGRLIGSWGGNNWYCCLEPHNCVIVFSN